MAIVELQHHPETNGHHSGDSGGAGQGGDIMLQLWGLITALSEQLNQNRSLSVDLHTQAASVKTQAAHSQHGFVLRRFNMDKTQEAYDAELERMNQVMTADNNALLHDNKQLSSLIKEFETTLETLMTAFRNRAQDVQDHELSLIRSYESKLLLLEEENAAAELNRSAALLSALDRFGRVFRTAVRAECNGEPVKEEQEQEEEDKENSSDDMSAEDFGQSYTETHIPASLFETPPYENPAVTALKTDPALQNAYSAFLRKERGEEVTPPAPPVVKEEPRPELPALDYTLERETELLRLEKENEDLRRMLGLLQSPIPPLHGGGASREGSMDNHSMVGNIHRPPSAFEVGQGHNKSFDGRTVAGYDLNRGATFEPPQGQRGGMLPQQRGPPPPPPSRISAGGTMVGSPQGGDGAGGTGGMMGGAAGSLGHLSGMRLAMGMH